MRRRIRRWLGLALAVAVAAPLLTGCTVPGTGLTGLTRDADGRIRVVLQACDGYIDSAVMWDTGDSHVVAGWSRSSRFSGSDSFIAEGRPADQRQWAVDSVWYGRVPPGRSYVLYGATSNNYWSTSSVTFDQRALDSLRPDLILINDPHDEEGRRTVLVDVETFTTLACALYDSEQD